MPIVALTLALAFLPSATFYVSPAGDDKADGSRGKPFATLNRALDWASSQDKVVLLPGRHRFMSTAKATARHRGLLITGEPGAIVSGSALVPTKAPDASVVSRLPAAAKAKVLQIDLNKLGLDEAPSIEPRGFPQADRSGPLELLVDGKAQTLARWPNEGFLRITRLIEGGDVPRENIVRGAKPRFQIDSDRPASWGPNDLWAYGYWKFDWADESLPVTSVSGREISLGAPHLYGVERGKPFYFENVLEELDRPGEYWLDPAGRRIVFWPASAPSQVEVSRLDEPLIELNYAADIRIENLTFEASRREAISVKESGSVRIEHCRFRNLGRYAIKIRGGQGNRVGECRFEDLGGGGVDVTAGDRKTLVPAGHRIENCFFRNFMRLARTYRPGVQIGGVGIEVRGCEFRDSPHSAIIFAGNDHLIEGNVFADLLNDTGDGGAVYGGRDWSARGTIIRDNLFWHLRGLGLNENGVYLDDQISGIRIERNAFVDCHWGVMVGGGRDNVVSNNLVANSKLAVQMDARGLGWAKGSLATMRENLEQVPYRSEAWRSKYPALADLMGSEPMAPVGNIVSGNLLVKSGTIRDLIEPAFAQKSTVVGNVESKAAFEGSYRDGRLTVSAATRTALKDEPVFLYFEIRGWLFGIPTGSELGPRNP